MVPVIKSEKKYLKVKVKRMTKKGYTNAGKMVSTFSFYKKFFKMGSVIWEKLARS